MQIPVEMFNSATRAKATAITSSAAWISNCEHRFHVVHVAEPAAENHTVMIAQVSPPAFTSVGAPSKLCARHELGADDMILRMEILPHIRNLRLHECSVLLGVSSRD